MATDIYMQIDGLKGEVLDPKFKDQIEILTYKHEIVQPASATQTSAGGASNSRCQYKDLEITKYIDAASPKLYEMCSVGKHISKVTLSFNRAAGDNRVVYLTIEMDQVMISRVAPALTDPSELPIETVAFNCAVMKWKYTQQKRTDGGGGGQVTGGYSLIENKAAA